MIWFVFQVLRSSEIDFNKIERKQILERITKIFSFELDPFSMVLNNIWIDYFGKMLIEYFINICNLFYFSNIKNKLWN